MRKKNGSKKKRRRGLNELSVKQNRLCGAEMISRLIGCYPRDD